MSYNAYPFRPSDYYDQNEYKRLSNNELKNKVMRGNNRNVASVEVHNNLPNRPSLNVKDAFKQHHTTYVEEYSGLPRQHNRAIVSGGQLDEDHPSKIIKSVMNVEGHHTGGGSFWSDFEKGFTMPFKALAAVAPIVTKIL